MAAHQAGYSTHAANSGTFSISTTAGRWHSAADTTAQAVERCASWCARSLPRARLWPWHAGLASSRSCAGTRVQSACCKSWQTCTAPGWLLACTCTAAGQWLAAHTTVQPAMVAPVEKPPAPAKRSIAFMLQRPSNHHHMHPIGQMVDAAVDFADALFCGAVAAHHRAGGQAFQRGLVVLQHGTHGLQAGAVQAHGLAIKRALARLGHGGNGVCQ